MSEATRYEDFLAHAASTCKLRLDAGDASGPGPELRALLAEVGARSERQGFEVFSLLFHVETGMPQQGMHAVSFDDGTRMEMFLVPIGREGAMIVYEAVFNRSIAG